MKTSSRRFEASEQRKAPGLANFNDLDWVFDDNAALNFNLNADNFEDVRFDIKGSLQSSAGATSGTGTGGNTGSKK